MTSEPSSETPLPAESVSAEVAACAETGAAGPDQIKTSRRILVGFAAGCVLSLAIIVPAEITRWNELTGEPGTAWLFDMNVDTTPYAVLFLLMPVMWLFRRPLIARPPRLLLRFFNWLGESPRNSQTTSRLHVVLAAMFVAAVSGVSCLRVASAPVTTDGISFGAMPPAYHDEYSYLFQAETFIAGRMSFPSHPTAPRLFDQMHVLNEGHFASRYFPGTGLWIAPFLQLGNPHAGHWVATMIVCVFVFLIGRELSCNGVGLLAGLLAALSPGLLLFGNLLLAHQPTLVGLGLFIYSFLRMQRLLRNAFEITPLSPVTSFPRRRETRMAEQLDSRLRGNDENRGSSRNREVVSDTFLSEGRRSTFIATAATLSVIGLSFAMLCRPMTAAGIGLPFGLWVAYWLVQNARQHSRAATVIVCGFAIPLMIGFGTAAAYNASSTGGAFTTPYDLYTKLFTPRHMYGFNNVERAQPLLTDRTLDNYDRWAKNLDAQLAVENVGHRFLASWQWTIGLVAIVLLGTVFLTGAWRNLDDRWWLIAAAILSLHVAHIPYWYDGIFHWHYVFESGVLWCLLVAAAVQLLMSVFREIERPWMSGWIGLLLLVTVTTNHIAVSPFLGVSRMEVGINQLAFSRIRYFNFQQLLDQRVGPLPALVLVRHDPTDRHLDYVTNHPSLSGPLLIGRLPADARTSEEETARLAAEAFPDRSQFVFDAATGRLFRLR